MTSKELEKRKDALEERLDKLEDIITRLRDCYGEMDELGVSDLEDAEYQARDINEELEAIYSTEYHEWVEEMEYWIHHA